METGNKTDKRKLYLVLPIVILPISALLFYLLDGGKNSEAQAKAPAAGTINTELPDAQFKEKDDPKNKLGYYELLPERKDTLNDLDPISERLGFNPAELKTDTQVMEIDRKLEALQREMGKPTDTFARPTVRPMPAQEPSTFGRDIDRLENLMRASQQVDTSADPETAQLNAMLQHILDIQHPELVRERLAVKKEVPEQADSLFRAIPATVASGQKVVQGATVKLVLGDTLHAGGHVIPKGHEVFGACRITNQRLLLDIEHIRLGNSIIPVRLTVYGLDGMEGIYAPEAVLTETMSVGGSSVLQGVGMYGLDGSLATQVAGAGLDAAKSVLGKRLRKIKVKLKAGEHVLLRNRNAR